MRRLERADVHRAFVAADHELAPLHALDLQQGAADGRRRAGVLQHGQLVVEQLVVVGAAVAAVGRYALRRAQDGDDGVDHVAAQLEHGPAAVPRQGLAARGGQGFADDGVDGEHLAQPAVADGAEAELEGGVVAEHVAHLHDELPACGLVEDLPEGGQRLARGLVEVDVLARRHRARRRGQQVAHLGLHGHRLQPVGAEQLLLGHPGQAAVGSAPGGLRAAARVGLDYADDLEVLRAPQRGHLPARVRVSRADLSDANPLASHLLPFPRRFRAGPPGQRGGQHVRGGGGCSRRGFQERATRFPGSGHDWLLHDARNILPTQAGSAAARGWAKSAERAIDCGGPRWYFM